MRILALDTATANCSAALLVDGELTVRERLVGHGHAELILAMIDEVLSEGAAALGSLDAVAFGRGPGSFTGVRLAVSVAQGLACGAGLPVVAVSDLRAVAQRLMTREAGALRALVCNDARMHEVYWACFERAGDGFASGVGAEQVTAPAAVMLPAGWQSGVRAHGAGTGFAAYPPMRTTLAGVLESVHEGLLPGAGEIAGLAVPEVAAGRVQDPAEALPVYLRDWVAQRPGAL